MRLFFKPLILALLMAFPSLAQIPAPQINLGGNIGCQGFPCVNNGTLVMGSDANYTLSAQETSAFAIKVTSSVSLTATRYLLFPAGRFLVTIENSTTGGQSLGVCAVSVGATCLAAPIPSGTMVSMWNDGTRFVATSPGNLSGYLQTAPTGSQTMIGPSATTLQLSVPKILMGNATSFDGPSSGRSQSTVTIGETSSGIDLLDLHRFGKDPSLAFSSEYDPGGGAFFHWNGRIEFDPTGAGLDEFRVTDSPLNLSAEKTVLDWVPGAFTVYDQMRYPTAATHATSPGSCTPGSAIGSVTPGSCAMVAGSDNTTGAFTINTGTPTSNAGAVVSVAFATPSPTAPYLCIFEPVYSGNYHDLVLASMGTAVSTAGFTVESGPTTWTASQTGNIQFSYICFYHY